MKKEIARLTKTLEFKDGVFNIGDILEVEYLYSLVKTSKITKGEYRKVRGKLLDVECSCITIDASDIYKSDIVKIHNEHVVNVNII